MRRDEVGYIPRGILPDQGYLTIAVGDNVVMIASGHQWQRGIGMKWWSGQRLHGHNPVGTPMLIHGHVQTFDFETTNTLTRIQ